MSVTIVVADRVAHAREIARTRASHSSRFIPTSERSIRHYGAARGFADVEGILVDDSAWPLSRDTLDELSPYNAPIYRLRSA